LVKAPIVPQAPTKAEVNKFGPPPTPPPPPQLPRLEDEVRTLTPRERQLTDLAEKHRSVGPQRYDLTSNHPTARRVIYDHNQQPITLVPGETKRGVLLHPKAAETLRRPGNHLAVEDSKPNA